MKRYLLILIEVLVIVLCLPIMLIAQAPELIDISMFPPPTGPYQVGRTTWHWVDTSRDEVLTDVEGDKRELVVRTWYPAEVEAGAELALATEDLSGQGAEELMTIFHMDDSDPVVQSLINLRTYVYRDGSVSDGQATYPVLVFSPGYCMFPEDYNTQVEELASHGYIVVGINHPYYSGGTVFPDGRVVACMDVTGGAIQRGQAQRTYAQDVIFVLDQLERLNTNDPDGRFSGRLDLERIGVIGSSMGGDGAVLAGSLDDRIRAVLSEDGSVPVDYEPLAQPFLLFATAPRSLPTQGPNYSVWVTGFAHASFTDYVILTPGIGSIEGKRTVEIVRAYIRAFFDRHLKGVEAPLLDGPSPDFPEVEIDTRNM